MKKSDYKKKYDEKNIVQLTIKLNKKTDKDIISCISMVNKQGSVKQLMRLGILHKKEKLL